MIATAQTAGQKPAVVIITEATNATSAAPSFVGGFNIKKILNLLPRRYPVLLVDRVISLGPHKSIAVVRNVMFSKPFFNGHFSGYPVMSDVSIFEALAQTAALLTLGEVDHERKENQLYLLVSTDGVRFKHQVTPNDQLVMTAELSHSKSGMWRLKVYGKVDGEVVVEVEIVCAVREDKSKGEI